MARAAAIVFEPDGYVLDGPRLMGRQAAGNAFLRAAVSGRHGEPLACVTASRASAEAFARLVKSMDARAEAHWIRHGSFHDLAACGAIYLPGPVLDPEAFLRLRVGPSAYSLVGVTHTTASKAAMDAIVSLARAPLMPWDALICTSDAVVRTVREVLSAEHDYLAWRFGTPVKPPEPALPVIPLGVHAGDFAYKPADRAEARRRLAIRDREIAVLFVGRLSFHAKAHPHAMYAALEDVARATARKLVLVQCGWFANESIEAAFKSGAAAFAPSVRSIFTNGKNAAERGHSWAAADIFMSLSDNVQETFGLAPLEAMAAGLPVVVSDWDGYRETVRDGIDGFRVKTAMPAPGMASALAFAHEAGSLNYDQYCAANCRLVSVDREELVARLTELVSDEDLRRRLGAAGRERAKSEFDWSHIYARYRALYDELAERRTSPSAAAFSRAPKSSPAFLDPTITFGHYASAHIAETTEVTAAIPRREGYAELTRHALYGYLPEILPREDMVAALVASLVSNPATVAQLAVRLGIETPAVVSAVAILAKMGLVSVRPEGS
ncbi:MAG: glycosyltransferase [Hyphomicrobium sp.]|nr:glycosyltransferase [Hyphomicrobium sp.]